MHSYINIDRSIAIIIHIIKVNGQCSGRNQIVIFPTRIALNNTGTTGTSASISNSSNRSSNIFRANVVTIFFIFYNFVIYRSIYYIL